jgi:glycosyltransferase involved in cell wall biosynthesis
MSIDISIIVCTRNRGELLKENLESLRSLKCSHGLSYEILVVDNGSTDKTTEFVSEFIRESPEVVKYYVEPQQGLSRARNCGVKHARGKIIAFTDDDVVVKTNWIQAFWNTFVRQEDVIAVQGKILLQRDIGSFPLWLGTNDLSIIPYYDPSPIPHRATILLGANMAIRKEAFRKYGLFDPLLGAGASGAYEETEFCMRLIEGNEKIYYQPAAVVMHKYYPERFSWKYVCEKQRQIGRSRAYTKVILQAETSNRLRERKKLVMSYIKSSLYTLGGNKAKSYKYRKKIHLLRSYLNTVAELKDAGLSAASSVTSQTKNQALDCVS